MPGSHALAVLTFLANKGGQFRSHIFGDFTTMFCVKLRLISSWRPQNQWNHGEFTSAPQSSYPYGSSARKLVGCSPICVTRNKLMLQGRHFINSKRISLWQIIKTSWREVKMFVSNQCRSNKFITPFAQNLCSSSISFSFQILWTWAICVQGINILQTCFFFALVHCYVPCSHLMPDIMKYCGERIKRSTSK